MGPLIFEPYLRPQIWGGRALGQRLGKKLPSTDDYGESWEISAHPHHLSVVAEGPHTGRTLTNLCAEHPREIYGDAIPADGKFPLLIKLLDCRELLSVQVHPDDATASRLLGNEKGKTEAWVVLDAEPEASIYAGLRPGIDRNAFERHVEAKTTGECLHRFHPKTGDCVFIPAGTVHTMGGGVLIAEVQQSSDATFRIFDWNRVGADGQPRALHLKESLASIDFARGPVAPVKPQAIEAAAGVHGERLVECPHFTMSRFLLRDAAPVGWLNPFAGRLSIWMVLGGAARLEGAGPARDLRVGQTVLIPAASPAVQWFGTDPSQSATLLAVTLPTESA